RARANCGTARRGERPRGPDRDPRVRDCRQTSGLRRRGRRRGRRVTVATRLARVEASLSPTELVVRWLAEAHAYDDLGSYSAALLDADPSTLPMDRLAREARASATER